MSPDSGGRKLQQDWCVEAYSFEAVILVSPNIKETVCYWLCYCFPIHRGKRFALFQIQGYESTWKKKKKKCCVCFVVLYGGGTQYLEPSHTPPHPHLPALQLKARQLSNEPQHTPCTASHDRYNWLAFATPLPGLHWSIPPRIDFNTIILQRGKLVYLWPLVN